MLPACCRLSGWKIAGLPPACRQLSASIPRSVANLTDLTSRYISNLVLCFIYICGQECPAPQTTHSKDDTAALFDQYRIAHLSATKGLPLTYIPNIIRWAVLGTAQT